MLTKLWQPEAAATLLAVAALVFVLVFLCLPLAGLARPLLEGLAGLVMDGEMLFYFLKRLANTLLLGLLGALVSGAIGLAGALALWSLPLAKKEWWLRAALLPFLVPVMVVALAIQAAFDALGWSQYAKAGAVLASEPILPWALLAGFVFYNAGLVLWMVYRALERIPLGILHTAQSLGAGYYALLRFVLLPLIRPALVAALAWVFLFCAGSFGLSFVLGGPRWATLEVEIYLVAQRELNLPLATMLAFIQALWSAIVVAWALRWESSAAQPMQLSLAKVENPPENRRDTAGAGRSLSRTSTFATQFYRESPLRWRLGAVFALGLMAAVNLGPLLALFLASISTPQGWSWAAYGRVLRDEDGLFWPALGRTLQFVATALPLAALLAWGSAIVLIYAQQFALRSCWLEGRMLRLLQRVAGLWAYLPYVVSASILSLALLLAYPEWTGSMAVLLAAYALLAYPLMTRNLVQAWYQRDTALLGAARNLGAGPWRALRHGVWPSMALAWRSSLALGAATMLGEFAVTLFLSRPEWMTLSTLMYKLLSKVGAVHMAEAQAVAMMLLCLAWGVFASLYSLGSRKLC